MGNNKLLRENKNTIVLLSVFVIVESTDIDIWIQKELVWSLGFLRPYQFHLESISTICWFYLCLVFSLLEIAPCLEVALFYFFESG